MCPVYPGGSPRGPQPPRWTPGPAPLRCYDDTSATAAAIQSFTAWRQNLLAISAVAAAAGAASANHGLEQHRAPAAGIDSAALSALRFDHCRLLMSHPDAAELNSTGQSHRDLKNWSQCRPWRRSGHSHWCWCCSSE